jgi:hypothetical protein
MSYTKGKHKGYEIMATLFAALFCLGMFIKFLFF